MQVASEETPGLHSRGARDRKKTLTSPEALPVSRPEAPPPSRCCRKVCSPFEGSPDLWSRGVGAPPTAQAPGVADPDKEQREYGRRGQLGFRTMDHNLRKQRFSVATLLWPSVGVKPNTWKK